MRMPEFPGYCGGANPSLPVIKVKAVTMRNNAILQTLVGPGAKSIPPSPGCQRKPVSGMLSRLLSRAFYKMSTPTPRAAVNSLGILQVKKRQPADEGRQGQAALLALATYSELKNIILVDEDVDIFDSDDILWAMTTRMQGMSASRQSPASVVTSWILPRPRHTARRSAERVSVARQSSIARCRGR